jgi:copper chaperone CopZ
MNDKNYIEKSEGLNHKFPKSTTKRQIDVKLNCQECCKYIGKTILEIEGVEYVDCNNKTGLVTIRFISSITSLDKIELAISDIGYDTPKYRRKVEFYTDIPKCCKHRYGGSSEKDDNPRA